MPFANIRSRYNLMKNHLNTLLIAFAVVLSSYLLGHAFVQSKRKPSAVSVTGLASRDFGSDRIVWTARFNRQAFQLQEAFNTLKQDQERVAAWLRSKNIPEKEAVFSSVQIEKTFNNRRYPDGSESTEFAGYRLTQEVRIESSDVKGVEQASREITSLINEGLEVYSESPRYYFTKLADLKIDLLAAAAKDARTRAENIAAQAGTSLDGVETAEMGIFQITGQNTDEDYSWGGTFNTASREKTASITVRVNFKLD